MGLDVSICSGVLKVLLSSQCFCHLASMSAKGYPPVRAAPSASTSTSSATALGVALAWRHRDDEGPAPVDDDENVFAAIARTVTEDAVLRAHAEETTAPRRRVPAARLPPGMLALLSE